MRVVESYSDGSQVESIQGLGQDVWTPALIEDDEDVRYLLISPEHDTIPVQTWVRAHQAGAIALVMSCFPVGDWMVLPVAVFMRDRTERNGSYDIPAGALQYMGPLVFSGLIEKLGADKFVEMEEPVTDDAPLAGRFVSLHTHSEYSALDGLSLIKEMVAEVVADGQPALAVTDHGFVTGHPELQMCCREAGIRPIFGLEAYFQDDRFRRTKHWEEPDPEHPKKMIKKSDSREALYGYTHITLWAETTEGLWNLWAMSTEAHRDGNFGGKPRLDWETLQRFNTGVICSTGCLRGPLAKQILAGDDMQARVVLGRLLEIFDNDRLVIELHTNSLPDQRKVNREAIRYACDYNIPLIACTDSHYPTPGDADFHHTWLAVNTGKDVTEETSLFGGQPEYFMHTADQVEAALAYLPADVVAEAMANTVLIADRCKAEISGEPRPPVYSRGEDGVAEDVRRLREICEAAWARKVLGKPQPESVYRERFEREMELIEAKRFSGYFLVVWDYVSAAKREGILVGPARGSGAGSLVGYLAGIVETDPIYYDLMFERFLTWGRNELPDFDIDFPTSKTDWIADYLRRRWGEDYAVAIGTVTRLQCKGAIDNARRALTPTLPEDSIDFKDFKFVSALIDEADAPLAGKHMTWDDICAQFADVLDPLRQKYPTIFAAADRMVGRVKTYGKHAAGMVISTDRPLTNLPLRMGDDGHMITQFDMDALAALGLVKFDLLKLKSLDIIQEALDQIDRQYGRRLDPYEWFEELRDPEVWEQVAEGQTLGVFQIETAAGTKLTKQFKPASVEDLAIIGAIVRPGPARSGLKDMYLRRRAGLEEVSYPDPRMESFLKPTYGVLIYQEQIMLTCMKLAGYDETEADGIRSILGKKKVEKIPAAGAEFLRRAVEHGTDRKVAESLWIQMAEFAKYGFGKGHSTGYALVGAWQAWLKFHYTAAYLTGCLSFVDQDRVPAFVNETRRMGYKVLPPDVNASGVKFLSTREGVRYGISAVKGIGAKTAPKIVANQPYESIEHFRAASGADAGTIKVLAQVGAFDSIWPNRRALEQMLDWESDPESRRCQHRVADPGIPSTSMVGCQFDWAHEPDPPLVKIPKKRQGECPRCRGLMVVTDPMINDDQGELTVQCPDCGGTGKQAWEPKPPPARCTVACRRYIPPQPLQLDLIEPYTHDDILNREREILGVYLTGTPFDRIDQEYRKLLKRSTEIDAGPHGKYVTAALISRVKEISTRGGDRMAFVGATAIDGGELDIVVFPRLYAKCKRDLVLDALMVMVLTKAERGLALEGMMPA